MLKILHTGDIHLGISFAQLGAKAHEHRAIIERTLLRIADLAITQQCDAVLCAGDLFDSNTPTESSIAVVERALRMLSDRHIHTILLPGTHDFLTDTGVYRARHFERTMPTVHVFLTGEPEAITIPELDLTVHGRAPTFNKSTARPMEHLKASTGTTYNIAMAHGSVEIPGKSAPDDWPIATSEIAHANMDYVALAHWHSPSDYSSEGRRAYYCGAPEPLRIDQQGGGSVIIAEWNPTFSMEHVHIGERRIVRETITVTTAMTDADIQHEFDGIRQRLQGHLNETLLFVDVRGVRSEQLRIQHAEIEEEFARDLAFVSVNDATRLALDEETLKRFPKESLAHHFIADIERRMRETGTQEDRRVLEETLQVGLAELEGKRIVE